MEKTEEERIRELIRQEQERKSKGGIKVSGETIKKFATFGGMKFTNKHLYFGNSESGDRAKLHPIYDHSGLQNLTHRTPPAAEGGAPQTGRKLSALYDISKLRPLTNPNGFFRGSTQGQTQAPGQIPVNGLKRFNSPQGLKRYGLGGTKLSRLARGGPR